jgi:phage FluMu protein Com
MATALLRFRCYKCDKLLGTSASKAGKTTTCPNCKAELIVPEPESAPDLELAEATRALIPNLDDAVRVKEPKSEVKHDPGFSWEEIDTAIFNSASEVDPLSFPINLTPAEPEPGPPAPSTAPDPEPLAAVTPPPLLAPEPVTSPTTGGGDLPDIEVEVAPVRSDLVSRPRARAGEVVLSQAVLVSWSLFVLLALAISFLAGLFAGHYLWKGR